MSLIIKNAHAILSGLPGEAARLAGRIFASATARLPPSAA